MGAYDCDCTNNLEYEWRERKARLSKKDTTKDTTSDLISKFIDGLEEIFADLRERHVDDSVCGLCEYDGAYIGQSGDWCNECPGFERDDCFKLSDKTRKEWTDEIIKALPTVQPEERMEMHACDLISRQAAIDALGKLHKEDIEDYGCEIPEGFNQDNLDRAIFAIKQLPPAQPEPRTGKWALGFDNRYMEKYYYCSRCGGRKYGEHEPLDYFCSNCGADMRGEKDG